jgi:hypothetical protein
VREADICALAPDELGEPFDAALCTLGLSVIPGWQQAWALERLFAADCTRRPWRLLERDTHEPTSRSFTWGWVTAAGGTKETT